MFKAGSERGAALLVGLALATTGCFTTWDIAPQSLEALNGYHEPKAVPLNDAEGEELTFDRNTELRFVMSAGAPKRAKFTAIQVSGRSFLGTVPPDDHPLAIDLGHVIGIEARKYSPLKTGLAIGIPVGAAAIAITVIAVFVATSSSTPVYYDDSLTRPRPGKR